MTEYELIDSVASFSDAGIAALMAYLTVTTGYLVTAYFVGKDLSTFQNMTVSSLFSSWQPCSLFQHSVP